MAEKQDQTENKALTAREQQTRDALAAANKVDATLEQRLRARSRSPVQFVHAYSRARQHNKIDPTVTEVMDYTVKAGEVVNLLDEEIARLTKDDEALGIKRIETDTKKFKPLQKWLRRFNPTTGKNEMVEDGEPIDVDTLIKTAWDAG